jgi:hypothetical protein
LTKKPENTPSLSRLIIITTKRIIENKNENQLTNQNV